MAVAGTHPEDATCDTEDTHAAAVSATLAVLAPRVELLRHLADGDGLTAAAARAGVPQPTATRWLAETSAALGTGITMRAGRGLRLTRAGELLVDGARAALADLRAAARAAASEADPRTGTVTLGFLHTLGETRVPELISGFRRTHPGVHFRLTQTFHEALLERLRDGAIDLALTAPLPGEAGEARHPDLAWSVLYEQPMRLVVPAAHRLAGAEHVRLRDLRSDTFITLKRGYGLRHITDALFARSGFTPGVAFEGEDVDTVRGLVGAGLGIAVLPAADRGDGGATVEVELSPPAHRRIGMVWPAARPLPPSVQAFLDHAVASRP